MTTGIPREVIVNGKKFKSVTQASKFFKVKPRLASYRINKGFSMKQVFGLEKISSKTAPRKVTVEGKTYRSIAAAARAYNVNPGNVLVRLRVYKYSIEEALEIVPRKDYEKNRFGRVYLITNSKNKKVYVGVTRSTLEKRLSNHIESAFKRKKIVKGSLQEAIIKLKPESFNIQEIDKAHNLGELSNKEIKWIKYFNSKAPNGYNLLSGGGAGSVKGKKIIVKGKKFKSITEACNYHGFKTETQRREISDRISKRGWTPDQAFNFKKKDGYKPRIIKKFKIKGKEFNSYGEAKRYFKTKASINLIASRIRLWGWSLEEALEIKNKKHPQHKEIIYKGIKYENIKSLCDDLKFDYNLFMGRFSKGWSIEKSLENINNNFNEVIFRGKKYRNEKELCEEYGVKYQTFRGRKYRYGWSLEDAILK